MTLLSRLFAGNATQQDLGRLQQVGAFLSSFGAAAGQAGSQGRDTFGGLAGALSAGSQGLARARQQMLQEQLVKNRLEESERKKRAAAAFQQIVSDPDFKNPDGTLKTREALKAWVAQGGDPSTFLQFKRDDERRRFALERDERREKAADRRHRERLGSAAAGRKLRKEELDEARKQRDERRKAAAAAKEQSRVDGIRRRIDTAFEKRAEQGGSVGAEARSPKGANIKALARRFAADSRSFGEAIDKAQKYRKRTIDQARTAIKQGKDGDAVLKRLKELGVELSPEEQGDIITGGR